MESARNFDELRDNFAQRAIELRDLAQVEIDKGEGDKLLAVTHLHATQLLLKELQARYPLRKAYQTLSVTWRMTYSDLREFAATIYETV